MPVYQWIKEYPESPRPEGTFQAAQINSLEDLESWVESLTEVELVGVDTIYSDVVVAGEEDDRWVLSFTMDRTALGEGVLHTEFREPYGAYAVAAQQESKGLWTEPAEIFESRFELLQP